MPVYMCSTQPTTLNDGQREQISNDIMRIHCDLTGAPPTFVHVLYLENLPAADEPSISVLGNIRHGRSDETKSEMIAQMTRAIAAAAGITTEQVGVTTTDVPATWVMEGGAVLPEPGEEADWLAQHAH